MSGGSPLFDPYRTQAHKELANELQHQTTSLVVIAMYCVFLDHRMDCKVFDQIYTRLLVQLY